jgi:hypothetical protein
MDKCGMKWERQPDDMTSCYVEYEPMTKCGHYVCSDECYKTWAFCPHCGKLFDYVEKQEDNRVE